MNLRTALPGAIGLSLVTLSSQTPAQAQDMVMIKSISSAHAIESLEIQTTAVETGELPIASSIPSYESLSLTFDEPATESTSNSSAPQASVDFSENSALLAVNEPVAETLLPETAAPSVLPADLPAAAPLVYDSTEAADLSFPAPAEATEIAQTRRRTRGRIGSSIFIGIGADFGYVEDVSFAVISKFALSRSIAIRPSALIGDDISILVPVTYEFGAKGGNDGGFQVKPYAGIGAAYSDSDENDSDLQFLVSAAADFPLSRQFTLNAQANLSLFDDDSDFGVTVGVGYNLGN